MSDTMSRSLSVHQEHELLLALEKAGIVAGEAQAIITSRKNQLAEDMVGWLREQLNSPLILLPAGLLTPVDELINRFMARNELRDWGFTSKDADKLRQQLKGHNHAGPLMPISISSWLGKDLRYNWNEALAWACDTARELGLEPQDYIHSNTMEFYQGSEIRGRRKLSVVGLDFQTFRNREWGIVPREQRPNCDRWPSLEVPFFLGLNPGYMKAMDCEDTPFLMAPGLVVYSAYVPDFGRHGREFFSSYYWVDNKRSHTAMVAFRELQH